MAPPLPSKIDSGGTAAATNQGRRRRRAPPRPTPFLRSVRGGGASGKPGAPGDGNWEQAAPRRGDRAGPCAPRPAAWVPAAPRESCGAISFGPTSLGPPSGLPRPRKACALVRDCSGILSASLSLGLGVDRETSRWNSRAPPPRCVFGENRPYLVLGQGSSPAALSPRPSARSRVLLSRWLNPDGTGLNKARALKGVGMGGQEGKEVRLSAGVTHAPPEVAAEWSLASSDPTDPDGSVGRDVSIPG